MRFTLGILPVIGDIHTLFKSPICEGLLKTLRVAIKGRVGDDLGNADAEHLLLLLFLGEGDNDSKNKDKDENRT